MRCGMMNSVKDLVLGKHAGSDGRRYKVDVTKVGKPGTEKVCYARYTTSVYCRTIIQVNATESY